MTKFDPPPRPGSRRPGQTAFTLAKAWVGAVLIPAYYFDRCGHTRYAVGNEEYNTRAGLPRDAGAAHWRAHAEENAIYYAVKMAQLEGAFCTLHLSHNAVARPQSFNGVKHVFYHLGFTRYKKGHPAVRRR